MKKNILISIIISIAISCNNEKSPENLITRPTNPVVDGQVQIGTQIWMSKNLSVSKYSDGTPIPQVTDLTEWINLNTGAWCYYANNSSYNAVNGKLYNWYAVAGIYNATSYSNPALRKKLAPNGWHVPTDAEWSTLINFLDPAANGGSTIPNLAGGKMKLTGFRYWQSPNIAATNESGFSGLPSGFRSSNAQFTTISFYSRWWSSSDESVSNTWYRGLDYSNGNVYKYGVPKFYGFSVRCVKD
jgi:uncharacterized protein (TIGR02145 family)